MLALLAQTAGDAFAKPVIDWHAIAPELVLAGAVLVAMLADIVLLERAKPLMPALSGLGLLASLIPLLTLADDGAERVLFGGAYVVDDMGLLLKAVFIVSAYVVVLLSTNYVAEGDYWEGEYYSLLLCSVLGMTVMASARDLVTIFVALELLSIPAYMLAAWRKRDAHSNEAGLKYYLMGVFAAAVMLYGMSLVYGVSGSTMLADIQVRLSGLQEPAVVLGVIFVVVGFAFKVSAVPFHNWAPDTYEGAPTPVTAFLAVASKAAGFVALIQLVFYGFLGQSEVIRPVMFILAAGSMTVGNLIALRQTNVVRMLAYSGVAQAGFMLAPFAVVNPSDVDTLNQAMQSIVTYLVIYAAMNLGAFAVVIAVARKTRSAEISSYGGLFQYAPGLTVLMSVFLFSLAGIPPLGGWYAKFVVFQTVIGAQNGIGVAMALVVAVNSVIALFYYAGVARSMWFDEVPDGDVAPIRVPFSLAGALAITAIATIGFGVLPGLVGDITEFTNLAANALP